MLPLRRNEDWGCTAERLRDQTDADLDEAVAALLEIGGAPAGLPPPAATSWHAPPVDVKLEVRELSPYSLGVMPSYCGAASPAAKLEADPAAERLPSASSGSDFSSTAAVSLRLDGSSSRSSFDSTAQPAGDPPGHC